MIEHVAATRLCFSLVLAAGVSYEGGQKTLNDIIRSY